MPNQPSKKKISLQPEYRIRLKVPHEKQLPFIRSKAKRKICRAGRRGGKTVAVSILAVEKLLEHRRVLYAAPTSDQLQTFWRWVTTAMAQMIGAGLYVKNETEHTIEKPGTMERIRAKTAWNADTLRGDYADVLILDEWQLMNEGAWEEVGVPMLLDNNGDAVFIYTPPSLKTRSVSKAKDPLHAAKMFKAAEQDSSGRWETFHWTSHDNPTISRDALNEITQDATCSSGQDGEGGPVLLQNVCVRSLILSVRIYNRFGSGRGTSGWCKSGRLHLGKSRIC
jgi:hypothetical protein